MTLMCPIHAVEDCLERRPADDGGRLIVCGETGYAVQRQSPTAPRPARSASPSTGSADGRGGSAAWGRVTEWDAAIEATILSGQYAGQPVYLDIEEDELAGMARHVGISPDEAEQAMIEDVSSVLALDQRRWLAPAVARLEEWERAGASGPPPILAVLGVLVLAAERMRGDEDMAGHNYYGRLCIDVLGLPEEDRDKVAFGFRRDAARLFEALNAWLEDEEGARGLPTAMQGATTKRYVHYPISQALLRAGDRDRLLELFAYYGLTPGSALPLDDLARLLSDYADRGSSRLGANLVRIVRSGRESLLRLAELVAAELESWDGTVPGRVSAQDLADVADLRLAGSLSGFPRRALRLALVIQASDEATTWSAVDGAAELVGGQEGTLRPLAPGWRLVETPGQPVWSSVLTGTTAVSMDDDTLLRRPRRVVALRWDDALSRWIEVERVGAGEDALLLVAESASGLVAEALEECARPGWRQDREMPGLPRGWVAFLQVQTMCAPTSTHRDLSPLVASDQGSLTLGGGLRLPGQPRRWHRRVPPEIRLSLANHEKVRLTVRPVRDQDRGQPREWSRDVLGVGVSSLEDAGLSAGDYVVQAFVAGSSEPLLKATLRLRDGDRLAISRVAMTPRDLGYEHDGPGLGLGAAPVEGDAALRGGLVGKGLSDAMPPAAAADRPSRLPDVPPWSLERRSPSQPDLVEAQEGASAPDCFMTGAHRYVLPTAKRGRPNKGLIEGRCSSCGKRSYWPTRPVPKGQWATKRRELIKRLQPTVDVRSVRQVNNDAGIPPEVVLDALTHLRDGTASDLDTVLRAGLDALGANQLARDLEALGHLEVERDDTLQPFAWRVAPPALSVLPGGSERSLTAVLTGARPPRLLEDLPEAAEMLGLEVEWTEQPRAAPPRIAVRGSAAAITETASLLGSREWPVTVSVGAAWVCVRLMPSLRDLIERLPATRPPSRSRVRRLDLGSIRWHDTLAMSAPGAYRVDLGYRSFQCLRTTADVERGVIRAGPQELVKHAAVAALGRQPLCAFSGGEMSTPGLVGLPGLLERAAVLCSGLVAEERTDGRRVYVDVPEPLAREVFQRLLP